MVFTLLIDVTLHVVVPHAVLHDPPNVPNTHPKDALIVVVVAAAAVVVVVVIGLESYGQPVALQPEYETTMVSPKRQYGAC